MNILLTGSGGFVGSHLLKGFKKRGYTVYCPRSCELNLTDKKAVESFFELHQVDEVVHCASIGGARGISDPENTIDSNILMLNNLLDCKSDECRLITFGSGAMYNKQRTLDRVKEKEIGQVMPKDQYGMSKVEISRICSSRRDCLCLNIFSCYGVGEKKTRFPSYVIDKVKSNEDVVINNNCYFDYLYVDDLVEIVDLFMRFPPKEKVINATPNESIELKKLAELVISLNSSYTGEIKIINQKAPNYTGDNTLLNEALDDLIRENDLRSLGARSVNEGKFVFTSIENGLKVMYMN